MELTAYDLYSYLNTAVEFYLDCIAIKEDPTESERKNYEYLKDWSPSKPDKKVKEILESLVLSNNKEVNEKEK